MDNDSLREQARIVIDSGKLPNRPPDRTWGGPGVDAECAICGRRTGRDEREFEIQFARDGGLPGLDKYDVHIRCFAAWELERHSAGLTGWNPLCPVCLEPIKASHKVHGLRDDLMHEGCDYTRRQPPPPKSPLKSPPRSNWNELPVR